MSASKLVARFGKQARIAIDLGANTPIDTVVVNPKPPNPEGENSRLNTTD